MFRGDWFWAILPLVRTCSAYRSQPQAGFAKVLFCSVATGEKATLKLLCWKQSSGWGIGWEPQCWHRKWSLGYQKASFFSLHFCIGSFRIYGVRAFFWKMEAVFRDDDDKRFPWTQTVTKSYSEQRPNIMGLNIKSEGNLKIALLSGWDLFPEGARRTSYLCFCSLPYLLPIPSRKTVSYLT